MQLADFAALAAGLPCYSCNLPLPEQIEHVDHDGGWLVEGFEKRQWLHVDCPNCKVGNSLWKIGIPGCVDKDYSQSARKDARDKKLARFLQLQFQAIAATDSLRFYAIPINSSADTKRFDQELLGGSRLLGWLFDRTETVRFAVLRPAK